VQELLTGRPQPSEPLDLVDPFYFPHPLRFTRMSPQEGLVRPRRIVPLYSIDALRVAFTLGGTARESELLHFEIVRRCSEELLQHMFAGLGSALFPDAPRGGGCVVARDGYDGIGAAPTAESLMQTMQRSGFDERKQFLSGALDRGHNPVWDVIDRAATGAALGRFDILSNAERRELYGAITAALWAGDDV
jgi:hypothetical protein